MPKYQKALMANGQLAHGMYTRGPLCATPELAKATLLVGERDGFSVGPYRNQQPCAVILEISDDDTVIIDRLPTETGSDRSYGGH
jgi:hypothetical protein